MNKMLSSPKMLGNAPPQMDFVEKNCFLNPPPPHCHHHLSRNEEVARDVPRVSHIVVHLISTLTL